MSEIRRPLEDDDLQRAFAGLSRDATFGASCPEPDRLWSAARGELAPADVEALTEHVATCGACAEAWRVARDFGGEASPAEAGGQVGPAEAGRYTWHWLAAAAAVLAAIAATLYFSSSPLVAPQPRIAVGPPATPPTFLVALDKPPIRVSTRYALTWRGADDGKKFLEALNTALEPYRAGDYVGRGVPPQRGDAGISRHGRARLLPRRVVAAGRRSVGGARGRGRHCPGAGPRRRGSRSAGRCELVPGGGVRAHLADRRRSCAAAATV